MRRLYDGEVDSAYFSCDLGASPEEVFFVDDTEVNVEGARTDGLPVAP